MAPLPIWSNPFLVNTTTAQGQAVPDIAVLADGRFAVVWADTQTERANKLDYWMSYRLQIFDTLGNKVGSETLLETIPSRLPFAGVGTNGSTFRPAIAGLHDGGMAVAFPEFAPDYSVSSIQIQFRNPDGSIRSTQQANQGTALGGNVEVVTLDTGETVVTWVDAAGVKARLFDGNGAAVGNEITIATDVLTRSIVEVTSLSGGRVAFVWSDDDAGLAPTGLYGAIMDSAGAITVPAFAIDANRGQAYSWGDNPSVTELANGNMVVAWTSFDNNSGWYITTRMYDGSGQPLGQEQRAITGNGEGPSIAALPQGGYILVWQTNYRIFDQNGAPVGDAVQFTDLRGSGGLFLFGETDVKVLADGRLVITWTGAGDIYAQILDPRTTGVTLNGTALDDQLVGTGYADVISGGTGNDHLHGDAGNDQLFGGIGADTLDGGGQNDLLDGGAGADTMMGRTGDDIYVVDDIGDVVIENENEGTDTIRASFNISLGNYTSIEAVELLGSADLRAIGDDANNYIYGNAGSNQLYGNAGNDLLDGGAGNDALFGGAGADWLRGGIGNDTLDGGSGADTLQGGVGDDQYFIDDAGDVIVELPGEGFDTAYSSTANITLGSSVEAGVLLGSLGLNIFGSADNNYIDGNDGANTLYGNAGADVISGGGGADLIFGGDGDDWLRGGAGDGDSLIGGAGADLLDGGTGADEMYGGAGDDWYIVDNAGDMVFENYQQGLDTVASSEISVSLDNNTEIAALTGSKNLSAYGTDINNWLYGNDGANSLFGGGGADLLDGGMGDDYLSGGAGDDSIRGGGGNDILEGNAGHDTFFFAPGGGHDVITDFEDNIDFINLTGWGFSTVGQALNIISDLGDDLQFNFADGSSLIVRNVAEFQYLSGDIII